MKVTIDIPAPSRQFELNSRLRQKVRNYKLSMKQLQRAHFVTKTLYKSQCQTIELLRRQLSDALQENDQLIDFNDTLQRRIDNLIYDTDSKRDLPVHKIIANGTYGEQFDQDISGPL